MLPLHLLFGAAGSARGGAAWLAVAAGVVLGPLARPRLGDFTLLAVGLLGGTAAFLAVRLWRRLLPRVVP